MALWLLMSGIYKPLVIGFGAGSVLLVVWVMARMNRVDAYTLDIRLKPIAFAGYILWLLTEIARANWAVTRIVLSRRMPIRQKMFDVPSSQKSDLGRVVFANSITLTPGTVSVEAQRGCFLVHALAYQDSDVDALADMDQRITSCEGEA
ncbi:MAG: Na+/H+ antiporter subunit E [Rhodobacteraceae bacterium]|nr:Na+/H+ antiporter subunit E [Paracoccaceae bacterium]